MSDIEPIHLTIDEAKTLVARAVEEKGADYVYHKPEGSDFCVYTENGEPGCIIGYVLFYKGATPEFFEGEWHGYALVSTSVDDLRSSGRISADDRTISFLGSVQSTQDQGNTWGEALDYGLARDRRNYIEGARI